MTEFEKMIDEAIKKAYKPIEDEIQNAKRDIERTIEFIRSL